MMFSFPTHNWAEPILSFSSGGFERQRSFEKKDRRTHRKIGVGRITNRPTNNRGRKKLTNLTCVQTAMVPHIKRRNTCLSSWWSKSFVVKGPRFKKFRPFHDSLRACFFFPLLTQRRGNHLERVRGSQNNGVEFFPQEATSKDFPSSPDVPI